MKAAAPVIATLLACVPVSSAFGVKPLPKNGQCSSSSTMTSLQSSRTMVDWEITKAQDEDIEILATMLERKREFDRDLNGEDFNKALQPRQGSTLKTLFPSFPQCQTLFIAEQDSPPDDYIGYATYGTKHEGFGPPYLWLEDIYIDPKRRSGGAGTVVMNQLAEEAANLNCTHLVWIVEQGNHRGIKFYEKLGAEIDRRDVYQNMARMKWVPPTLAS
ncbi:hypothetical protein MPSEU_000054600 [Mayamaea pseudoterrestris]|nr:hypothetical protein MPSEU_000054600 [Mayamaea pseudoterrestris]